MCNAKFGFPQAISSPLSLVFQTNFLSALLCLLKVFDLEATFLLFCVIVDQVKSLEENKSKITEQARHLE